MPAADIAAYASVIALVVGALARLTQIIIKKRRERQEINAQLDKAPFEIKEREAELIDKRIRHLDGINSSLARHIRRQDEELARQDGEIRELHTKVHNLEKTVESLTLERDSLQRRLNEFQAGPEATV